MEFKKSTIVYIDDIRNPLEQSHIDISGYDNVVWVKSYVEFCNWLFENGLPDSISFDHDLHENHYAPKEHWVGTYRLWRKENPNVFPTGLDCAKTLVDYCKEHDLQLPIWSVHSSNPIGSYEITEVLMTYAEKYYLR